MTESKGSREKSLYPNIPAASVGGHAAFTASMNEFEKPAEHVSAVYLMLIWVSAGCPIRHRTDTLLCLSLYASNARLKRKSMANHNLTPKTPAKRRKCDWNPTENCPHPP